MRREQSSRTTMTTTSYVTRINRSVGFQRKEKTKRFLSYRLFTVQLSPRPYFFSFQAVFPLSNTRKLGKKSRGFPTRPSTHNLVGLPFIRPNVVSGDSSMTLNRGDGTGARSRGGKAFQLIRVRVRTRANNSSKGGYILVGNIGGSAVRAIRNNGQGCRHGGVEARTKTLGRCNFVNRE